MEITSCCYYGEEKQYNALLVEFDEKPVNAMELGISTDFIFQDIFVIIQFREKGQMVLDQRENIPIKANVLPARTQMQAITPTEVKL